MSKKSSDKCYLLSGRVLLAFNIIILISEQKHISIKDLMRATGFSYTYVQKCCLNLRDSGILKSRQGKQGKIAGYQLVNSIELITISDVLNAVCKIEDRNNVAISLNQLMINELKGLTINKLQEEISHGYLKKNQ